MFDRNDELYLVRALGQNRVLLFLGAGFSSQAINNLGAQLPVGNGFARTLWDWLGYEDVYDDTPLPDMYEAALAAGRPERELADLLGSHLQCAEVPGEYDALSTPNWFRIYTTNVDDLVPIVYRRASDQKLDQLVYPHDEPRERDQSLRRVQAIYLHGMLPCRPGDITFSVRQFARRTTDLDPLYEQFVRENATHPTIFVGTALNEPLFWQYIEMRGRRAATSREHRRKSFLISPRISPPKRAQLEAFNIVPVEGTAFEFLSWIRSVSGDLPPRAEILRRIAPNIAEALEAAGLTAKARTARTTFSLHFHRVPTEASKVEAGRSQYLLGATPQWDDILRSLDAPRELTAQIDAEVIASLDEAPELRIFALLGSAGCGKSTILRRLGIGLARAGRSVYLTNSEELPSPRAMAGALDSMPDRAVLLFDNAEVSLALLPSLVDELRGLENPPMLLLASRTNDFDRKAGRFATETYIREFHVPRLTRREIEGVIRALEQNNLLGRLQGMSAPQQLAEFEDRAEKQILVAMREATSGRGFDEIIRDEFESLQPHETQVLYLCVALATDLGFRLTTEEFLGCANVAPNETLNILRRNLRDIVVLSGATDDLLMLRHRRIAEYVLSAVAPRPHLREAYIRLLSVLASEVVGKGWRSRTFGLYRALVNHQSIYRRFPDDINEGRAIYDAISHRFRRDAQFWLQYGSLELEALNLEFAENYLDQAQSLDSENRYVQNARGHLLLEKAIEAPSMAEGLELRDAGSKLLLDNIYLFESPDAYSYHIYVSRRVRWMQRWVDSVEEKREELEHLRGVIDEGESRFPRNRQIRELKESVEHQYLSLAVSR